MGSKDYLPANEGQFIVWYDTFLNKLPTYTATLDIAASLSTELQTNLTSSRQKLNDVQAAKTTLNSTVELKDDVLAAAKKLIRDTVVVLKRHKNFRQAIGEDLGIMSVASLVKYREDAKPLFTTTVLEGKTLLDWVKAEFDGVLVQCKRGSETEFTTIGRDAMSPYEDERSNLVAGTPETRIYRMRYLLDMEEVANWSDEVKVVCLI